MRNIQLNNGENVIINTLSDAVEVIKEKLSYELGQYIESESDYKELEEERDMWEDSYEERTKRNLELKSEIEDLQETIRELRKENNDLQVEINELERKNEPIEIPEDELPFC